jgi:hypothetical protein
MIEESKQPLGNEVVEEFESQKSDVGYEYSPPYK